MLIAEKHAPAGSSAGENLELPFEARCKSRLRARLANGEEIGLFLQRGQVMRHGDLLETSDGRIVAVQAAPETLMEVRCDDALQLARAAYHLGNRHVPVEIGASFLRFAADHVLAGMVRGLGLPVEIITAPFEPEAGAYGSGYGHSHLHDGAGSAPKIHEFRP